MTNHSPEPWTANLGPQPSLDDANGDSIVDISCIGGDIDLVMTEADARRIAACVNACKGIPSDDLPLVFDKSR